MRPRRYELLVFDWDGTLMDSAAAICAALQSACRDLELNVPADSDARYIIGLGLNDAMAHILPDLPEREYPRVVDRYREHFLAADGGTMLFPGAEEMIAELSEAGHLLAVATGKSRRGLNRALAATGLGRYFHATRCGDEGFSKPHPGMLHHLVSALGGDEKRTLMIGDTIHDLQMARNAGVAGLAVAYGAHGRDELLACEPVGCVEDFGSLRDWLRSNA